eukprot:m.923321 g.923321  ORF g.923321 m.923321 type:complete len:137 (+) comp23766_c1_seq2:898-1308(+)
MAFRPRTATSDRASLWCCSCDPACHIRCNINSTTHAHSEGSGFQWASKHAQHLMVRDQTSTIEGTNRTNNANGITTTPSLPADSTDRMQGGTATYGQHAPSAHAVARPRVRLALHRGSPRYPRATSVRERRRGDAL